MNLNIYRVSEEFYNALYDCDNEDFESKLEEFNTITDEDIKRECLNLSAYAKNLDLEINTCKLYEEDMRSKRRSLERKSLSLKEHIKNNMVNNGIKKIHGDEFDVSVRKNPSSVVIEDEEKVSDEYMFIKKQPNKKLIKDDLKNGIYLEFAKLVESTSLQIK